MFTPYFEDVSKIWKDQLENGGCSAEEYSAAMLSLAMLASAGFLANKENDEGKNWSDAFILMDKKHNESIDIKKTVHHLRQSKK